MDIHEGLVVVFLFKFFAKRFERRARKHGYKANLSSGGDELGFGRWKVYVGRKVL